MASNLPQRVHAAERAPSLYRPVDRTLIDFLVGLRAGAGGGLGASLFAQYVVSFNAPFGDPGGYGFVLGDVATGGTGGAAGVGYNAFGLVELSGYAGYRAGSTSVSSTTVSGGPIGGVWLRVGGVFGGLGVRAEAGPGAGPGALAAYVTLDIAPLYWVGKLL